MRIHKRCMILIYDML